MKRIVALLSALVVVTGVSAQQSINALFIGNSYTEVNNLPEMISNIAENIGDHIVYQSNTPGGCTFAQHCNNQSMTLIRNGGWDVVVLQEQSQYPSFPQGQVENEVFPYAKRLVDSIYANSPCAEPMFYMTWGRKNGDHNNAQYFPILGTYEGMDSMLYERYMYMAEANDASVCPVGRVWHWLRRNSDIELYQSDESHPSVAGTYAAACAFYTMFFHRDPNLITYRPNNLSEEHAQTIRNAANIIVYTQMEQWTRPLPNGDFDFEVSANGNVHLKYGNGTATGGRAMYNTNTQEAYLLDNVVVIRDDMKLTCASLINDGLGHMQATGNVDFIQKLAPNEKYPNGDTRTFKGEHVDYYPDDRKHVVIPTGGIVTSNDGNFTANYMEGWLDEEYFIGTGDVHIVSPPREMEAGGDRIDYFAQQNGKAILTGNAWVVQKNNTMRGNKLTVYLAENQKDIKSDVQSRKNVLPHEVLHDNPFQ